MFIGRHKEIGLIKKIIAKDQASILIVYGRRRVGKTELIEHSLKDHAYLKLEGKEGQNKAAQLKHCLFLLAKYLKDPLIAKLQIDTWTEFFNLVADKSIPILYLEELQWLASYKTELISDLKEVWDNHFKKNPQFKLILCGSAPSFMISNVIRSKALYNRAQYAIPLMPFSLSEVHDFLGKRFKGICL
ncbi:MAG: AAA family ATPase [Pseudobdellovibrionaceae bacterium]